MSHRPGVSAANPGDPMTTSRFNRTALHHAAGQGHDGIVTDLLRHGAAVDARTKDGRTALQVAASAGHPAIVKQLLAAGADVAARDDHDWTALHYAARGDGHVAVVTVLLEHGADAAAQDKAGQTPRDRATRHAVMRVLDQATGTDTP